MRLLIISSSDLFCQCLTAGLAGRSGVEFVACCSDLARITSLVGAEAISSCLVDMREPEAIDAVRICTHLEQSICVLALSVDDHDAAQVLNCARLGCHGIVPRSCSLGEVAQIIRRAERGEVAIMPEIGGRMMRALAETHVQSPEPDLTQRLTRREREICCFVADGMTNKEISLQVNRSEGTVKNHVQSILAKLELPRRSAIGTYLARSQPPVSAVCPVQQGSCSQQARDKAG